MNRILLIIVIPIIILIVLLLSFTNSYSIKGDTEMGESLDLASKCSLGKIDKIIVTTEKFTTSYSPPVNKIITDKKTIKEVIESLQSVQGVPVCDTKPQYTLAFYESAKQIAALSFFIDGEWYFLRLDSNAGQKDYKPGKTFIELWKKIAK